MRATVGSACDGELEWPQKVGSVIRAVLEFAAREPAAARDLVGCPPGRMDGRDALTSYFSGLLDGAAPTRRYGASTDEAIIDSLACVIRAHLLAGTTEDLPELASDFTWLALLPYAGSAALADAQSGPRQPVSVP